MNMKMEHAEVILDQGVEGRERTVHFEIAGGEKEEDKVILLLPGTGTTTSVFRIDPSTTTSDDHLQAHLVKAGFKTVTVDLRGHGKSTAGTIKNWKVEDLADDVAEGMKSLLGEEVKFHIYGLSVGFGVGMSLSVYYPEMVLSLSGSGFLFDRSKFDFSAWFFSREPVVRMLGKSMVMKAAAYVSGFSLSSQLLVDQIKEVPLDSLVLTSQSWLQFNLTPKLENFSVPLLVILPEKDAWLGHSRKFYEKEFAMMPKDHRHELVEFEGYSHLMVLEPNGASLMAKAIVDFIETV